MRKFAKIFFAFGICVLSGKFAFAAQPILVTQPVYQSMQFYVYKPENLPSDWRVTYDGYLVYKDRDGVWYYGSDEGLLKTGYVVGAVIPSVVRLKPYNKRISNIAPILNTNAASSSSSSSSSSNTRITNMNVTPRIYTPPSSFSENFSSRFTAVGLWGASVDRIGVLDKPAIPVAWKGDNPEIIYAWTGNLWTQLLPLKNSKAINTLRNAAYDLKREATKTRMKWTDDDTHALSNYAASWGYEWLGVIKLSESD